VTGKDTYRPEAGGPWRAFVLVAVLAAAGFALFVALITAAVLSTNESNSRQTPLLVAQLVVAVVGLIPAGLFAFSYYRAVPSARVWFVIGVAMYIAWGILNNAAVHGAPG
jgi:hypothetical protein